MNKAAGNIHVWVFMSPVLLGIHPEVESLVHMITVCLTFWRTGRLFPKWLHHFIPTSNVWGCQFLQILPSACCHFDSCHSYCEVVSPHGFDLHFSSDEWKSHGRRSLVGCSPWGCWELDMTERLHFCFSLSCIGEGNGNPLQCSCLENPRDGEAWWAAIYGASQSQTRLKWLSSSSSDKWCLVSFLCAYQLFAYLLWRNIYSGFLPLFKLAYLSFIFHCWVFKPRY